MAIKEAGAWDQPVMVKVNGKEYPTQMYNGVQRFVPNSIIEYMVDNEARIFNKNGGPGITGNDLNTIAIKVLRGELSFEDYVAFSTMHGYSVSGFCDSIESMVDNFDGDADEWFTIENPLWEKN